MVDLAFERHNSIVLSIAISFAFDCEIPSIIKVLFRASANSSAFFEKSWMFIESLRRASILASTIFELSGLILSFRAFFISAMAAALAGTDSRAFDSSLVKIKAFNIGVFSAVTIVSSSSTELIKAVKDRGLPKSFY